MHLLYAIVYLLIAHVSLVVGFLVADSIASSNVDIFRNRQHQFYCSTTSFHLSYTENLLYLKAKRHLTFKDTDIEAEEYSHEYQPFFSFLLEQCTVAANHAYSATSADVGSGSSEWHGFWTDEKKLKAVVESLKSCQPQWRGKEGGSLALSWLGISPIPLRTNMHEGDRFGVYLTMLPPGSKPPAHRPMIGSHILSKVCSGEIEQIKANSQRIIGCSTHSPDTSVWNSFGGGVRRFANISNIPAFVLEIVFYGTRGTATYDTRAPDGGAAERNCEANEFILSTSRGLAVLSTPPIDPIFLFQRGKHQNYDIENEVTVVKVKATPSIEKSGMVDSSSLKIAVGGLDEQLDEIVRRVLKTRSIPVDVREALGVSHVRGVLLHGPPGCGKTLLARELAKRLNSVPPKLVSGPEILDKWVGEAERKVRELFSDAEEAHDKCIKKGEDPYSLPLHIICFDELDALCRERGSLSGDTSGVRDSVVNQILAKMDGLVGLQNLLVVGMTNRRDLLDSALLRPGRFEVSVYIPTPNHIGRIQILNIHMGQARENNLLDNDIRVEYLASRTDGFSGADIAGLVRSAISFALTRWENSNVEKKILSKSDFKIKMADFEQALAEIKPSVATIKKNKGIIFEYFGVFRTAFNKLLLK